jgi:hypothetical protein
MKRREFITAIAATSVVANAESAEQTAPKPSAKPLTLTLLGTGTPAPSLARQSSGYLIEVGLRTSTTTTAWNTDGWCSSAGIRAPIAFPISRSTGRRQSRA